MNCALFVIDAQKGVMTPRISSEFTSKINQSISKAKNKGWEVIFSKHINSEAEKRKFKKLTTLEGSVDSELIDNLQKDLKDKVFEKTTYSLFGNKDFDCIGPHSPP